ncbi:MAG: nucleoside hydrolase [Chthoniobacterales bacterium]
MMRRWLFLCWLLCGSAAQAGTAVWIDTDPAIGAPWREVDDGFALILALHSPEVRITGVSSSYGNAELKRTTTVAREIVRRFGQGAGITERDVHPGAASARDGEKETAASEALARALRKEKLTYVALAPLTNLAAFLHLHPELAGRIERIIFVGGRSPAATLGFGRSARFHIRDANVRKDPDAVAAVLHSAIPLTLVPVEIAPELAITPNEWEQLRTGGAAGKYLAGHTWAWLAFWTTYVGERGGLAFDLLAVLPVLDPPRLRMVNRFAELDGEGNLIAYRTPGTRRRAVRFGGELTVGARPLVMQRLRE